MAFYLSEAPHPHPSRCCYCGETRGEMVTSSTEIPGYGHLLSCEPCDREKARLRGYAKGKRMTELVNAASRLGDLEKELQERDAVIQNQLASAAELQRSIADKDTIIEFLRGKERQQEHLAGLLAENARQLIEVRTLQPA